MAEQTLSTFIGNLAALSTPVLTWYGKDRIELSGANLARWLAKTENLLAEEFPFGGGTYLLDAPLSWRIFPWDAVCRFRGWVLSDSPDLLITDSPMPNTAEVVVAQPLESLALTWPTELAPGIVDGAADVMGQADQLLVPSSETLTFPDEARRRLIFASHSTYRDVLDTLGAGGTAVVVDPLYVSDKVLEKIRVQEKV
ncbi:hypothetical protein FYJ24_03535 [Actinomycetaceae bacterium WB03_NA08]|uniref:Uncharacterized protein n=1 Tax=Scrofimicrobium canadense TaxID=2652290 RepID=A0A6N7VQ51_9ACTO|nr:hypothetical protein [Scrofimicrobium canadense]MSS83847.1 hypothetical protein [Scrofimicrobium canadense]